MYITNKTLRTLFLEIEKCEKNEHILNYFFKAINIYPENFLIEKLPRKNSLKKIIIHPGASKTKKKWGIDNYARLINLINNYFENPKFIITGGKGEINENNKLCKMLQKKNIEFENLTGKLSIKSLLELIKKSDLLISSDTFIQHLGALTPIKSVTIFLGGSYHFHTFPYQLNKIIIYPEIECYPCNYSYNCKKQICKNKITPQDIFCAIIDDSKKNNILHTYKRKDYLLGLK